jgi:putative holliday junction resolvase
LRGEKKSASGNVLGFDYGRRYIGVALVQELVGSPRGLCTLERKKRKTPWNAIANLFKDWNPDKIVVGYPLNMDGSRQALTDEVDGFIAEIEKKFKVEVLRSDERLSSIEARAEIFEKHGYRGLTKEKVNQEAARVILEQEGWG